MLAAGRGSEVVLSGLRGPEGYCPLFKVADSEGNEGFTLICADASRADCMVSMGSSCSSAIDTGEAQSDCRDMDRIMPSARAFPPGAFAEEAVGPARADDEACLE